MKHSSIKKLLTSFLVTTAVVAAATISASACTTIYVGGKLMKDGVPVVARSEDYTNSRAKLFYISPAGEYRQGELYIGCRDYGAFEWTWNHDSYRFVAFKADNDFNGLCPECGEAGHPSYTESGTNEKGVTVSATESLSGNGKVNGKTVDPLRQTKVDGKVGIEESDIPTVILSEAATAREGVELLLNIYDNYGCYYASGLFIADQKEIWYIENCSGTQYIALKLNDDLMFLEPNISVIGRIDLDDTENVIASNGLIDVAKQANAFVGNEEENIIDFRASYARLSASSKNRLSNGLNFLNENYSYTEQVLLDDSTLFTISNLDESDVIVPLYTNIQADRTLTVDDIVNYYKVDGIANTGNTDTAFFQIYKEDERPLELGTVEWTSMSHGAYNVFIPNYPLLMDQTYEGYRYPAGEATKDVAGNPDSGLYYRTSGTGKYTVLPENWEKSFYWCFDGLSNYILYSQYDAGAVSSDEIQDVLGRFKALQETIYTGFDVLNENLDNLDVTGSDKAAAKTAVTEYASDMAEQTHTLALELTNELADFVRVNYMDGSTQITKAPIVYRNGQTITAAAALEKSGYTFLGWDTASAANTVVYKPGDQFEITENTILYAVWQEQSSGGGSSSSTYAVTVSAASDGSVTASPKQAAKGSTITLTIKPNSGYQLDTLKVTDKGGNTIKTTANNNGTYTFQMPASAVTVKATFVKIEQVWKNPFQDVSSSSWYYEAVRYATENGLFSGISENTFAPNSGLTRGMLVQVLWSVAGKPAVSSEISFSDVAGNAWYAEAVRWATANHIVSGIGDGKFGSDVGITREQLALILYNYAGKPTSPSQQLNFADADKAASWSVDALRWAIGAGLFSGRTGGILDPQGPATRAEVAQMMMKFGQL